MTIHPTYFEHEEHFGSPLSHFFFFALQALQACGARSATSGFCIFYDGLEAFHRNTGEGMAGCVRGIRQSVEGSGMQTGEIQDIPDRRAGRSPHLRLPAAFAAAMSAITFLCWILTFHPFRVVTTIMPPNGTYAPS